MSNQTARERIPRLVPQQLSDKQRAVYNAILHGDRAKRGQHFQLSAADGSLNGPFGLMLHEPELGAILQELGSAIRFRTSLTPRIRETAILQVAHSMRSEFELWAHEKIARAAGLSEDEIVQLSIGAFRGADAAETGAANFCRALLGTGSLTDDEFAAASAALSTQALIEITILVGYYKTLAQLMQVFLVSAPS